MKRRKAISLLSAGLAGISLTGKSAPADNLNEDIPKLKGNINHSVCLWTYNFLGLEGMCAMVKKMGVKAIDLLAPKDWPTIQKHDITCSMC